MHRTNEHRWLKNDEELPEFRGLLDIDLGITPSTNTLPIRRLTLAIGESKEITVVWVRFPELMISALPQRYTRIDACTYLYESMTSKYQAKIAVDSEQIVCSYEDAWERL